MPLRTPSLHTTDWKYLESTAVKSMNDTQNSGKVLNTYVCVEYEVFTAMTRSTVQ
jgi:hypothetical protein